MKTILYTLLATIVITLNASAAPLLVIEATIADKDRVLSRPTLTIPSGEVGWIKSGDKNSLLTQTVTPTLLDNGRAAIEVAITHRKGKTTDKLASRMVVDLGQVAEIRQGALVYTMKASLEKLPGHR